MLGAGSTTSKTVAAACRNVARQVVPPATRLEHKLYPWVYFGILPLFALTNADVELRRRATWGRMFASPVFFGVFFGLLVGKPRRHHAHAASLLVKLKLATCPRTSTG